MFVNLFVLQNKILHNRLESMHVKLAETEHVSSSTGLRSGASDTQGESDLQNVINYLRRSKEIVCVFSYYYNCDKASFYGFQNF